MQRIQTLKNFYETMNATIHTRKQIVSRYLQNEPIPSVLIEDLNKTLNELQDLPQKGNKHIVTLSQEKPIELDLNYEIQELKKDIFFLEHTEEEFYNYLTELHPDFDSQLNRGLSLFKKERFNNFISDRDGTVNNYCARYASSVQSAYNAIFLSRFALSKTKNTVILTSAPLMNIGLVDISVSPENTMIFAGSKGREYIHPNGDKRTFPIEKNKQKLLDFFNQEIQALLEEPANEKYALIGSGLQYKFGQTTIARQDICATIPEEESLLFLYQIQKIVHSLDPENQNFRIEDTGLDIEVILTIGKGDSEGLKDFDKGDGIQFLNRDIPLNVAEGPCLICGDTNSDIPMVTKAQALRKDSATIFVTMNDELRDKVNASDPNAFFVSSPDILVCLLNALAKS